MPPRPPPDTGRSSGRKHKNPQHTKNKPSKSSTSARGRFLASPPPENRQHGMPSPQSGAPQTRVALEDGPSTSTQGSHRHGSSSPSEGPESSSNQFQHLVPPSELYPNSRSPNQPVISALHGAHDFSIGGNSRFLNVGSINQFTGGTYGLEIIQPFVSFDAFYDSSAQDPQRRCHPGTRERILKQMRNWVDDPNGNERILWLHGPAGVGKSAIAQTIANSYGQDKIAATFFFFRSDTRRSDGNRLFPTLAWQLAVCVPEFRNHIAQSLNDRPDLPRKSTEIQFERLISQPLQSISEAVPHLQSWAPVVIIDGVDECSEEKLQERFLNILGKAVADRRIPLRFLISSRPEALIQDTLDQFRHTILQIDLAKADGAYLDVEKYLQSEFTLIASKQGLDSGTWPGQSVIQDLTSRSSGQFIYASTVIKFVGDDYNSAPSQLDIILGLVPSDGQAPFSELDALYLEILRRQRDQTFLKDFLWLFFSPCDRRDYALLLNTREDGLLRKLRGMHSVLKTEPTFGFHHRSFLDFLQELSRSRQYHITKQASTRRYLVLIVEALVRYASKLIENPDYHGSEHFAPEFGNEVRKYPRWIDLPVEDWEGILSPLLTLKDRALKTPKLNSPWRRGLCDKCSVFYIIDDLLLHLALYRYISHPAPIFSQPEQRELIDISSMTLTETHNPPTDLNGCLSSLISFIGNEKRPMSLSKAAIDIFHALLVFDPTEIALRIQSVSDAQNLVDLATYIANNRHLLRYGLGGERKVMQLVLEIYARIPIFPRFCPEITPIRSDNIVRYRGKAVKTANISSPGINPLCQRVLIWVTLSHNNIAPLLGVHENDSHFAFVYPYPENGTLWHWRRNSSPSVVEIHKHVLEVAKAIQYVHSHELLSMAPLFAINIGLDSDFRVQVPLHCLYSRYCHETPVSHRQLPTLTENVCTYEDSIFMFGCLFYEVYFDISVPIDHRVEGVREVIANRPDKPDIHEGAWKLIQRCCAEDPTMRPTMDQVVEEIQSLEIA